MTLLFSNNAQTTLAGAITNTALTANLASGSGALFPQPTAGQSFHLTFVDAATGLLNEIVNVTNVTGDTITMVRAQEGTTALNWSAGDIAAQFVTAGDMGAFLQGNANGQAIGALTGGPQAYNATTGSLSFPTGTTKVFYQGWGGGGAGGGAAATGAGQVSVASGGNVGSYVEQWITVGFQGASLTIGGGGSAVVGANGNLGGATILTLTNGTVITAPGGGGGVTVGPAAAPLYAAPGTASIASGGYLDTAGIPGGVGLILSSSGLGSGGQGGSNPRLGSGGNGGNSTISVTPGAAQGYSTGGGGAAIGPSTAAIAGGVGAGGFAIFWPYA